MERKHTPHSGEVYAVRFVVIEFRSLQNDRDCGKPRVMQETAKPGAAYHPPSDMFVAIHHAPAWPCRVVQVNELEPGEADDAVEGADGGFISFFV